MHTCIYHHCHTCAACVFCFPHTHTHTKACTYTHNSPSLPQPRIISYAQKNTPLAIYLPYISLFLSLLPLSRSLPLHPSSYLSTQLITPHVCMYVCVYVTNSPWHCSSRAVWLVCSPPLFASTCHGSDPSPSTSLHTHTQHTHTHTHTHAQLCTALVVP